MYRNAADFCMLILFPATLLNSFISSNNCLCMGAGGDSSGCSTCKFTSSVNRDSFTFSFPTECLFPFSCLVALAGAYSAMLNRSGESEHIYLVFSLKGIAFSFLPLYKC